MSCVVFPGQGSQYVGMSRDFWDNYDIAKKTLKEIEDYTKIDLKKIIFDDLDGKLNITKYTQISIFAASMMIFKTVKENSNILNSSINVMMGHSLGEYTSLACADKLSLKDCSLILKKRGELMHNAVEPNKSGMAALIGKDAKQIEDIIQTNNLDLEIANDNSPMQVVISGNIEEIMKNKDLFLKKNVKKYIVLNVSAAFHSKFMSDAEKELSSEIEKLDFRTNGINIISNYTSEISNNNSIIKNSLKKQMSNRVRWVESIKKLEEIGEKTIIEIGPNKVLSGLINRISKNFDIKSINEITELDL